MVLWGISILIRYPLDMVIDHLNPVAMVAGLFMGIVVSALFALIKIGTDVLVRVKAMHNEIQCREFWVKGFNQYIKDTTNER